GFRRAVELFSGPMRPADDRVQVTRPIASRAEVHGFEAPDDSLTLDAWQRASAAGDSRRPPAGQGPPLAAESLTLNMPGRRLRLAPDSTQLAPAAEALAVLDEAGGTFVRLSVMQERTLVFRLIPAPSR